MLIVRSLVYLFIFNFYNEHMKNNELLYEFHVPRKGWVKIWPTSINCPICENKYIFYVGGQKPLYIPRKRGACGEFVVVYVCTKCYNLCNNCNFIDTVSSAKEAYKCHSELRNHIRSLGLGI